MTLSGSLGQSWLSAGLAVALRHRVVRAFVIEYQARIDMDIEESEAAISALRACGVPDVEGDDDR